MVKALVGFGLCTRLQSPKNGRPKRRSGSPRFTMFFVGGNRVCWKTQKPRGEPDPKSVVRICLLHDEGVKTGGIQRTTNPRYSHRSTRLRHDSSSMVHSIIDTGCSSLDSQLALSLSLSLELALSLSQLQSQSLSLSALSLFNPPRLQASKHGNNQ